MLRKSAPEDVEVIFGIIEHLAEPDYTLLTLGDDPLHVEKSRCMSDVRSDKGCCLVYESGGIQGFIYAQDVGETARIRYLYVAPDHRRRGINYRLYDACESDLREKGYTKIIFGTAHDNIPVKIMGEKRGFEFLKTEGHLDFYIKYVT